MQRFREWLERLWGTVTHRRTDADLNEELRVHAELAAEEHQRRGLAPDAARRAAAVAGGGHLRAIEALRDQRGLPWLEHLSGDVRDALRQMRRNRAFSAIVIATRALGIGINTAMFSAVDAVLIKPLPYADAGRLVTIWNQRARVRRGSSRARPNSRSGVGSTPSLSTLPPRVLATPRFPTTANRRRCRRGK